MSDRSSTISTYTGSESDDEELAIESKRALAYLQDSRSYRYVEFLAQGGYGWVALVYDDENSRSLAIKCSSDISDMELSWWPRLKHPNILPLIEHITLENCTVFIMPAMRKDLWTVVNEEKFYEQELSFGLCRIWLRDLATALDYLHSQFLCHLDLKLDNVFLKEDGYVCLGDFSLLADVREVPSGFHFLEVYEPPEYTEWCHGAPPEAIEFGTIFGGDKADMWQYGILAADLLTDLKITDAKSSKFTLFHHDVWPTLQKILLHQEYFSYLLEQTFMNVVFEQEDITTCHNFLNSILRLEPSSRMSAEEAKTNAFTNIAWPQLPRVFTVPELAEEALPEPLPLPKEQLGDPSLTMEEVIAAAEEKAAELPESPSIGALDVMKKEIKKKQKDKMFRRESIAVDAGKMLLGVKRAPSVKGLQRKQTPYVKRKTLQKEGSSLTDEDEDEDPETTTKIKETITAVRTSSGKQRKVKVTAIKKSRTPPKSKDDKTKNKPSSSKKSK